MEKLDIVNLGTISPYLGSGLCMINKYKYYNTNTLFYYNSVDTIVKMGLEEWTKFIDTTKIENYTKVRTYFHNVTGAIDFISPKETLFFIGVLKEIDEGTYKTILVNTMKNTFLKYNKEITCLFPTIAGPFGIYVDNIFRLITTALYSQGLEYPNNLFSILFKFSRKEDQEEIMKREELKKYACYKDYYVDNISLKNHMLLFNEVFGDTITKDDFILSFYTTLSEEMGLELNIRNLTTEEVTLFSHIEESHSNINWIENAIHPDFPYLRS